MLLSKQLDICNGLTQYFFLSDVRTTSSYFTTLPSQYISTLPAYHWKRVFDVHPYWKGTYRYRGQTYTFRLQVALRQGDIVGNVTASKARFSVKGIIAF